MQEFKCSICHAIKFRKTYKIIGNVYWWQNENGNKFCGARCYECSLIMQQIRRKKTQNLTTKKYEKTKRGFLMRTYRNMKSRVTGVTKAKNHLYLGLMILMKHKFYQFSLNDKEFNRLFEEWVLSGYVRRLTPSIDRINSKEGYSLKNIRWLTHSQNSFEGSKNRYNKIQQP